MRPRPIAFLLLALVAVAAIGFIAWPRSAAAPIEVETAPPEPTPVPMVVVDVQGAVVRPGVYQLPAGSRVADALAAAGGFAADADPGGLNRAAVLADGARVYAPLRGETPPAGALGSAAERLIDINRATTAQLATLPGVGPSTAEKIVRSREKAPFRSVDELQFRGLVAARVFKDIRELVTVR